jgi:NAD-dependent SIR2 family protein deacetylase
VTRTVIFLGAGASAAEGAPVQRDLFRSYFGDGPASGRESIWAQQVAEFFRIAFAIDITGVLADQNLPTFEEVLGLIDLAMSRGEGLHGFPVNPADGAAVDLASVRRRLILVMADAIRRRVPDVPILHNELIKNLRQQQRLTSTTFITTNYDTLIDNALDDLAVDPTDRLAGPVVDYGFDELLPPSTFPYREERRYPLYKLHGSLNWLYCPICTDLVITYGASIVERLLDHPARARCTRCDAMREPVIVPPTYYKDLTNVYLAVVWNRASREMRDCVNLVFCGYSLPDADMHIKYLIKAAQLNREPGSERLRITLVNQHPGKSAETTRLELERYSRLFGSSSVLEANVTFEQFTADPAAILRKPRL